MTFRPFTDADRSALVALWDACDLSRPWNPAGDDIDAFAAHDASEILVSGDPVVATVAVGYDGHRGWVYYVAVHPDQQGTGLGQAAMRAAEAWLRARGVIKMQLMVRETNDRVIGFYESLGFEDAHVRTLAKWLNPERDRLYRMGV